MTWLFTTIGGNTHICTLFERLVTSNLTINLAKCEFTQATVFYLDKVVGRGQVHPVTVKILIIDKFPPPITKKKLMRYFGMIGYYRSFCSKFFTVLSPFTDLLKKDVKFHWSDEYQQSFENAKLLLSTVPVLAAPKLGQPFKLQVDASRGGAGTLLLQTDDNEIDRLVCFFSCKFNKHQLNYSTVEKEAFVLIWPLNHFDVYVRRGWGASVGGLFRS